MNPIGPEPKSLEEMNRSERRWYFKVNRVKKILGDTWNDWNWAIKKQQPYINYDKRDSRRAYIKARRVN